MQKEPIIRYSMLSLAEKAKKMHQWWIAGVFGINHLEMLTFKSDHFSIRLFPISRFWSFTFWPNSAGKLCRMKTNTSNIDVMLTSQRLEAENISEILVINQSYSTQWQWKKVTNRQHWQTASLTFRKRY